MIDDDFFICKSKKHDNKNDLVLNTSYLSDTPQYNDDGWTNKKPALSLYHK